MKRLAGLWVVLLGLAAGIFSQSALQVGYAVLDLDAGTPAPAASALFTYTNASGVLVSQAAVGAVEPAATGRIYADEEGGHTGLALVNANTQAATVNLTLRDSAGSIVSTQTLTLAPGEHVARFLGQWFSSLPLNFTGSLTYASSQPLGAVTLRQSGTYSGDPSYTTLPVANLSSLPAGETLVFPHIAAGGGYRTQLILINTTTLAQAGQLSFVSSDGNPLAVTIDGQAAASGRAYQIPPDGALRMTLDRPQGLAAGYAVVRPNGGSAPPAGAAVFQLRRADGLVTEAGVGAAPLTNLARLYVEHQSGATFTGVAVANPSTQSVSVTFALLDTSGLTIATATRLLGAQSHLAIFAHQLFPDALPETAGGATAVARQLEISASAPIYPITLKLTQNSRGDGIYTTFPVADLSRPASLPRLLFPHIAIGPEFSTRLILLNSSRSSAAADRLAFFQSNGSPMVVPYGDDSGSRITAYLPPGGGRQFFPGNAARVAAVSLIDPSTRAFTKEVAVNVGGTVQPLLDVRDSTGMPRDDLPLRYASLDSGVATIDDNGVITGRGRGFSTLTLSSGAVVQTVTITVVGVDSSQAAYAANGITQDRSQRLYLTAADHTILLADDISRSPDVYAGIARSAGLKNDVRLQSVFRDPAFLAFDQARGTLYVSDSGNHVIRRIQPGANGRVDTAFGSGVTGARDGVGLSADFNNPQGLALDGRGGLWVADAGNHTIRRVSLSSGTVTTVAGSPGTPGLADGSGSSALFRSPVGLAFEPETLAQQLERDRRGEPPPPVSVIVADTGNGVLRRVSEDGSVRTLRIGTSSAGTALASKAGNVRADAPPLGFREPAGVAVDPQGNIFVTEPGTGRVRAVLPDGTPVAGVQEGTFERPRGISIGAGGRVSRMQPARRSRRITETPGCRASRQARFAVRAAMSSPSAAPTSHPVRSSLWPVR